MPKYIILLMPQEFLDEENSDEESYSEKKSDEENWVKFLHINVESKIK